MKLVTFGIDENGNLIVQFPVFVWPYTQLILYQIKTVSVTIIDQNKQANSYTHLQVDRPYIALYSETNFIKVTRTQNMLFHVQINNWLTSTPSIIIC